MGAARRRFRSSSWVCAVLWAGLSCGGESGEANSDQAPLQAIDAGDAGDAGRIRDEGAAAPQIVIQDAAVAPGDVLSDPWDASAPAASEDGGVPGDASMPLVDAEAAVDDCATLYPPTADPDPAQQVLNAMERQRLGPTRLAFFQRERGLLILDVCEPSAPRILGQLPVATSSTYTWRGDRLLLIDANPVPSIPNQPGLGTLVVDVSDPSTPQIVPQPEPIGQSLLRVVGSETTLFATVPAASQPTPSGLLREFSGIGSFRLGGQLEPVDRLVFPGRSTMLAIIGDLLLTQGLDPYVTEEGDTDEAAARGQRQARAAFIRLPDAQGTMALLGEVRVPGQRIHGVHRRGDQVWLLAGHRDTGGLLVLTTYAVADGVPPQLLHTCDINEPDYLNLTAPRFDDDGVWVSWDGPPLDGTLWVRWRITGDGECIRERTVTVPFDGEIPAELRRDPPRPPDGAETSYPGVVAAQAEDGTPETGLRLQFVQAGNASEMQTPGGTRLVTFSDTTTTPRGLLPHAPSQARWLLNIPDQRAPGLAVLTAEMFLVFDLTNLEAPELVGATPLAPKVTQVFDFEGYIAKVRRPASDAPVQVDVFEPGADLHADPSRVRLEFPPQAQLAHVGSLLVGLTPIPGPVRDENGQQVAIQGLDLGLRVVDLSDPAQPGPATDYTGPSTLTPNVIRWWTVPDGLAVLGRRTDGIDTSYRVELVDLRDPGQPQLSSPVELPIEAQEDVRFDNGPQTSGTRTYLRYHYPNRGDAYVALLDVGDLAAPRVVGTQADIPPLLTADGSTVFTAVSRLVDEQNFFAGSVTRVARHELRDDTLVEVAAGEIGGRVTDALLDGQGRLLVTTDDFAEPDDSIGFLTVLDAQQLTLQGMLQLPNVGSLQMAVGGNYVAVSAEELLLFQIAASGPPTLEHAYPLTGGSAPLFDGSRFIVAQGIDGLLVVDILQP